MLLPSLPKNKWLAMSSWHCKCWIRYCRREKCKFPERNQCSILNPVELLMIFQLPISRQQPAFVGIKGRAGKTSIPNERLRFESSTQLFCPFSVANHIGYFRQLCYANIHFLTASGRLRISFNLWLNLSFAIFLWFTTFIISPFSEGDKRTLLVKGFTR